MFTELVGWKGILELIGKKESKTRMKSPFKSGGMVPVKFIVEIDILQEEKIEILTGESGEIKNDRDKSRLNKSENVV